MRILVVHGRYRSAAPSGENNVVDRESAALAAAGHDVHRFERHSDEIDGWSSARKAMLPVKVIWNGESRRDLAACLAEVRPDVVHVHNTFPMLSPSVLHACRDAEIPVVYSTSDPDFKAAFGNATKRGVDKTDFEKLAVAFPDMIKPRDDEFIVRKARRHTGEDIVLTERERRMPLLFLWPRVIHYLRHKDRGR